MSTDDCPVPKREPKSQRPRAMEQQSAVKRTMSTEAQVEAINLRARGYVPASVNPTLPNNPYEVLGSYPGAEWSEVRRAFIQRLTEYPAGFHPEAFMAIQEAYEMLKKVFRAGAMAPMQPPAKKQRGAAAPKLLRPPSRPTMCLDQSGIVHAVPGPPVSGCAATFSHHQRLGEEDDGLVRTMSIG